MPLGVQLPNWHSYSHSALGCYAAFRSEKDFAKRQKHVLAKALELVMVYAVDPVAVHREFLKIAEYADALDL